MEVMADSCEDNPTLKIIQIVNKRYDDPSFGASTTTKWYINSARGVNCLSLMMFVGRSSGARGGSNNNA